ncbi:hypothetical protein V4D30_07155 [Thermodesulfovibrio sp. 3907-1M]|uniref:Uncharacterized protein n=1 Tax=Thermodesulfovibrio autotrophicus TaxID=3118333 RepID=A0AAU8GWY3_9BACT
MIGLPELILLIYLISVAFWIAGIVVAIRIKQKKAFYIPLAVLSLPVLMFLNRVLSIFLIKNQIVSTFKSSVIAFAISSFVICALQISIFFYMKKIKNRTVKAKEAEK